MSSLTVYCTRFMKWNLWRYARNDGCCVLSMLTHSTHIGIFQPRFEGGERAKSQAHISTITQCCFKVHGETLGCSDMGQRGGLTPNSWCLPWYFVCIFIGTFPTQQSTCSMLSEGERPVIFFWLPFIKNFSRLSTAITLEMLVHCWTS